MATPIVAVHNLGSEFELGTRTPNKITVQRATSTTAGLVTLTTINSAISAALTGTLNVNITGTAAIANTANAVAWGNVTGKPTYLSYFTNDKGYLTAAQLSAALAGGGSYVADFTAPPTPTGVVVTPGLTVMQVQTDSPSYTVGNGHQALLVYAVEWPAALPTQPTFDATYLKVQQPGYMASFAVTLGSRWVVWTKWLTNDDVESALPSTGVVVTSGVINGVDLAAGLIEASHLADGSVSATKLADASIGLTKFANGLQPVLASGTLPLTKETEFVSYDSKLWRWDAALGRYTKAVETVDLIGSIGSDLIADAAINANAIATGAVTSQALAAGSVTTSKLTVTDLTNLVTDSDSETGDGWDSSVLASANVALWRTAGMPGVNALTFTKRDAFFGKTFPVKPGDEFWCEAQVSPEGGVSSAYTCSLGIRVRNSLGSSEVFYAGATSTLSGPQTISGAVTVPTSFASADNAIIWFHIEGPAATTYPSLAVAPTQRWHATRFVVRRKSNANLIVDGSITTTKLAAGTVTADKIAANSITGDKILANSITGDKIVANSITTSQIAAGAITASQLAAGAITTGSMTITGRGTALNVDPQFDDATAWIFGAHGVMPTFVTDLSDGSTANALTGIQNPVNTGASCDDKDGFTLLPDKQYLLSVRLKCATGTTTLAYIRIVSKDAAGNTLAQYSVGLDSVRPATAETWTRFEASFTSASVGNATLVGIRVILGWGAGVGQFTCRDARVEEKVSASLIVDGGITATKLAAGSIVVGSAAIANGAISNAMLGTAVIDSAKIADGAITTAKIGTAQITAAKIASIDAGTITTGTLAADRL